MSQRALILFGHGARDSRWAEPFQRLQKIVQAQVPQAIVSLAFLELMAPDLPALVAQLVTSGCDEITVVPVFFGQGGHVLRDLPVMVEQLQKQYPALSLKVASAVGESPEVLNAIAQYCVANLE
jgi:sirohydrochlorin cobaltochelatase